MAQFVSEMINKILHLIAKKDLNELDDNINTLSSPSKHIKLSNGKSMLLGFEFKFFYMPN